MQLANAPSKIVEAFAVNGQKNTIPVASQIPITPGAASYNDGFPPLTMTPVTAGGVPPSGLDMNGILNEATALDWWMSAGAGFPFDATFAATVGGYPKGARVLNAASNGYWLNTLDNNSTNPDTGAAPTGWIPDSKRAVASVYAAAQQTLAIGNSKVLWDTVEFDTLGLWDAANKRFKAPWAGVYRLSGYIYLPSPASGQNLTTQVYKNGTLAKQCFQFPQVTDQALGYPFDAMISCVAGDYLETFMDIPTIAVLAGQVGNNESYVFGQLEYMGT